MKTRVLGPIVACALLLGGCASSGSPSASEPTEAAGPSQTPESRSTGSAPTRGVGKSPLPEKPEAPVEDPAPGFAFETFEGEVFRLSDHRGTPVVLNFWESW